MSGNLEQVKKNLVLERNLFVHDLTNFNELQYGHPPRYAKINSVFGCVFTKDRKQPLYTETDDANDVQEVVAPNVVVRDVPNDVVHEAAQVNPNDVVQEVRDVPNDVVHEAAQVNPNEVVQVPSVPANDATEENFPKRICFRCNTPLRRIANDFKDRDLHVMCENKILSDFNKKAKIGNKKVLKKVKKAKKVQ